MNEYLKLWADGLLKRASITLESRITVVGERNQHLGPRCEFAKIQVSVEPASGFEVVDLVPVNEELRQLGYPDWAVFGLLDVLMVAESAPITNVRVTLEKAEFHPIDSSAMAFRQAGRDAARRILKALKENPSVHRKGM
jgi:hypothetical protein